MTGGCSARSAAFLWEKSNQYLLLSIPLFILLGEINLRAGLAGQMYSAVAKWLSWLPGGLMHANIGSSAIFAATSGSSVATAATIGTVAYPEIERRKYNEPMFSGLCRCGGHVGHSDPAVRHVDRLRRVDPDISARAVPCWRVFPGLMLAALFSLMILFICILKPDMGGDRISATWRERFLALIDLIPPAILFLGVIGTIYAGLATPTEAASIGVVLSLDPRGVEAKADGNDAAGGL